MFNDFFCCCIHWILLVFHRIFIKKDSYVVKFIWQIFICLCFKRHTKLTLHSLYSIACTFYPRSTMFVLLCFYFFFLLVDGAKVIVGLRINNTKALNVLCNIQVLPFKYKIKSLEKYTKFLYLHLLVICPTSNSLKFNSGLNIFSTVRMKE